MAYCTPADILNKIDEAELIQATDDEDTGAVNQGRVETAIEAADAEIDGYLGSRYPVPIDPAPPILNAYSVDMAIYHVFLRRLGVPESRQKRYDSCLKTLEKIAAGKISLGVDDPVESGASNRPQIISSTRIFSRDSMGGW